MYDSRRTTHSIQNPKQASPKPKISTTFPAADSRLTHAVCSSITKRRSTKGHLPHGMSTSGSKPSKAKSKTYIPKKLKTQFY